MPITVRNEFEVTSTNVAVGRLKQLVERRMHIPTALQSLFFNGMELQDDGTLVQFGVDLNSTLFLIVRGDGNQENPPLLNEDDEQGPDDAVGHFDETHGYGFNIPDPYHQIEIVASCGDYRLSRFEMHSVLPCSPVSSKVINIVAAYMCETESECWYLPTQFGDIAESYADPSKVQVGVDTTINICRLQRFYRRLRQCDKIFIPLYDELLEHWYLLVMNIAEKKGELWDSKPESSSYDRRMSLVGRAIKLLQKIFANEMYRSTDVYLHFPSFNISVPQSNPTHDNNYDSGIFVIRHMQHHNNTWYTQAQFHLNDLRMRIAVEIVTHPRNTIINSNSTSSSNYSRSVGHNAMALKRRHAQHSEIGKCGANHDFQFVRQNSSNAPNGRKCRSHRLRRSRA